MRRGDIKRLLETIDTLERQLEFERYNTDACRSWAVHYQNLWFGRANHIDDRRLRAKKTKRGRV